MSRKKFFVLSVFLVLMSSNVHARLFGDIGKVFEDVTGVKVPDTPKPIQKPIDKTKKEAIRVEKKVEKEINRTDENLHRHIKTTGKAIEKGARDTRDFVDENKKTIAVVAAAAVVGWAACADGCTVVGSLLFAGASGTAAVVASTETTVNDDGASGAEPKPEDDADDEEEKQKLQDSQTLADDNTDKTEVYPYEKRGDGKIDLGPPLYVISHAFAEPYPDSQAEIAMPTSDFVLRNDGAGGVMLSRRKQSGTKVRRNHAGIDAEASIGTPVLATLTGYIERQQNPYSNYPKLTGVRIVNDKGFASGIFYVELADEIKDALENQTAERSLRGRTNYKVIAGKTIIGKAQDISINPANTGVVNHVHTYWESPDGKKISPDGRIAVEPKEK